MKLKFENILSFSGENKLVYFKIENPQFNNFNILIHSRLKSFGQSVKYNLKAHLKRFNEILDDKICVELNLTYIYALKNEISNIIGTEDLTFKTFINDIFDRILLKIATEISHYNFYYSTKKIINLFKQYTIITKNLISKYYY